MRFFNTAGPIQRDRHYHVPPLERLDTDDVRLLIRQWKYFVLHAPRQTGKTSALLELRDQLNAAGEVCCDYVNVEVGQTALIRSHGASGWRKDSRSVACAERSGLSLLLRKGAYDHATAIHDFDGELTALEQGHADERIAVYLVHGDAFGAAIPDDGGLVDVEQAVAAVGQHGPAPPAPDEAELLNERCRECQEAVETGVDDGVDLAPLVSGSTDVQTGRRPRRARLHARLSPVTRGAVRSEAAGVAGSDAPRPRLCIQIAGKQAV